MVKFVASSMCPVSGWIVSSVSRSVDSVRRVSAVNFEGRCRNCTFDGYSRLAFGSNLLKGQTGVQISVRDNVPRHTVSRARDESK